MMVDRGWLRSEAARQGLRLSDEDLEAIGKALETTKATLAALRPALPEWPAPPHGFLPPARPCDPAPK